MKKKFSVITPYIPLLVIIIAFVIVIFYNKNKDFGLSNDAINAEEQLSAEETVRLYFYYSNRRDDSVDSILNDNLADYEYRILKSVSIFDDIYLIDVKELSTEYSPNERGVYEIKTFHAKYNYSFFIASGKESENTIDFDFELIKQESDSPWKIVSIGNG